MSDKFTCESCNEPYDENTAAEEFNSHFDGEFDYFFNGWEGYCSDCAICEQENREEPIYSEDNPPPGCRACGGPFPQCTTSCPIFDD